MLSYPSQREPPFLQRSDGDLFHSCGPPLALRLNGAVCGVDLDRGGVDWESSSGAQASLQYFVAVFWTMPVSTVELA